MTTNRADAIPALTILRQEHADLLILFEQYQQITSLTERPALLRRLCEQTRLHFTIEAGVFCRALFKDSPDSPVLAEVGTEYAEVVDIVNELADPSWAAISQQSRVAALSRLVRTHVFFAEAAGGLFETAATLAIDWPQVAESLRRRRRELEG